MPNPTKDLRGLFLGARNQHERPTCLAFAMSDAHSAGRPPHQFLSPEYLYYHGIMRMPKRNFSDGISLPVAIESLRDDGQPIETAWPYSPVWPRSVPPVTPPAGHATFRASSRALPNTIPAICAALDVNQPAVLAITLTESFFRPGADGVIPVQDPDGAIPGAHAVIAVGYERIAGAICRILIRNSWGEHWGDAGHGWLDVGYLAPKLISVTAIATSP